MRLPETEPDWEPQPNPAVAPAAHCGWKFWGLVVKCIKHQIKHVGLPWDKLKCTDPDFPRQISAACVRVLNLLVPEAVAAPIVCLWGVLAFCSKENANTDKLWMLETGFNTHSVKTDCIKTSCVFPPTHITSNVPLPAAHRAPALCMQFVYI